MTQLAQTVDPAPLLPAQIGDYRAIPIAAIRIGPRLRYLRPDAVSNLAINIAEHGLHVAISVAEEAADAVRRNSYSLTGIIALRLANRSAGNRCQHAFTGWTRSNVRSWRSTLTSVVRS